MHLIFCSLLYSLSSVIHQISSKRNKNQGYYRFCSRQKKSDFWCFLQLFQFYHVFTYVILKKVRLSRFFKFSWKHVDIEKEIFSNIFTKLGLIALHLIKITPGLPHTQAKNTSLSHYKLACVSLSMWDDVLIKH